MADIKQFLKQFTIALGMALAGIPSAMIIFGGLIASGIEIDFGGDKSAAFLALLIGIPLGAITGVVLCNKGTLPAGKMVLPALIGLMLPLPGIIGCIYLVDLLGDGVFLAVPCIATALAMTGFWLGRKLRL